MNNENYITKDFNLAGYLLFKGYKLIGSSKNQTVLSMFTFEDDGSIKVTLEKILFNKKRPVEPIRVWQCAKNAEKCSTFAR